MTKVIREAFLPCAMIIVICVLFINGCAAPKRMALWEWEKVNQIDLSKESIALFTLKTSNIYKPNCQPFANFVFIKNNGNDGKEERYAVGSPVKEVEKEFNQFLISIQLPAGEYELNKIEGSAMIPGNCGNFIIPINSNFAIKPNSMIYLGRIEAVNRKRENDNELRAGPMFPIINQATAGYYTGTFDIKLYNNFEEDVSLFIEKYPFINSYEIEKKTLLLENYIPSNKKAD